MLLCTCLFVPVVFNRHVRIASVVSIADGGVKLNVRNLEAAPRSALAYLGGGASRSSYTNDKGVLKFSVSVTVQVTAV